MRANFTGGIQEMFTKRIVLYLNEQKVYLLTQATVLADEFILTLDGP